MDRFMRSHSGRRCLYLLAAAIVIAVSVTLIVCFAIPSKSNQQQDIATTYRRCDDDGSVKISSFKIDNCRKGTQGHCLARQGEDVEISVEFEPSKLLEKVAFEQERRKDSSWILMGTGDPCKQGLKCPCEANSKQKFKNYLHIWDYKRNTSDDFRLKLGRLDGNAYMCLEFTLDIM